MAYPQVIIWKEAYRISIYPYRTIAIVHNNLGISYQGKGLLNKAIACYQRAIELDPDLALAYCNLGTALQDKVVK